MMLCSCVPRGENQQRRLEMKEGTSKILDLY